MSFPNTNILARLTPPGTGAIATLAICGPDVTTFLEEIFTPAGKESQTSLQTNEIGRFWFGRLGEEEFEKDEVVVALKQTAPFPLFEIHCHGGRQVVGMLEELLTKRGMQKCSWSDFHQTVQPVGTVDCLQELSKATTIRTAAILLDQFHGAFRQAKTEILELLGRNEKTKARQRLRELAKWIPLGLHLTSSWKVAIAGAPNVGKSSLINRLAGYHRCVVSSTPGTTRDVVTTSIVIDGWPIELIDTAGMRAEAELLEKEGIDLAMTAIKEADLCLWLVDGSSTPDFPSEESPRIQIVINKTDLPYAWDFSSYPEAILISAETGSGLDELCDKISQILIPETPPAKTAIPYTVKMCESLTHCLELVSNEKWSELEEELNSMS